MDDQFKHFEDKQKFANLTIEKRFVDLETKLEDLKDSVEKASLMENASKDITHLESDDTTLKQEIENLKQEKKKDLEQLTALIGSIDVSEVKRETEALSSRVATLAERFDQQVKGVEMLEERILDNRPDEKIRFITMKIKELEAKLENMNVKLVSIVDNELTKPIFIE